MIKRFFIAFLGSLAGIWFSLFLAFIGFFMLLSSAIATSLGAGSEAQVKKGSYLTIDLEGTIDDRPGTVSAMDFIRGEMPKLQGLNQILGAIKLAAEDKNIEGIVLECKGVSAGTAQLQALVEALRKFKAAAPEKWIYSYGDAYTQGDYFVATTADSIFINPTCMVELSGLSMTGEYIKNLLDKLDIEMQVVKVGTYKSAVEPYILTGPSEPAKMQEELFMNNIWSYLVDQISAGRKITAEKVRALANSYTFTTPADSLVPTLVDAVVYRHEFDEKLMALTDVKKVKDLSAVSVIDYIQGRDYSKEGSGKGAKIAVYYASGEIYDAGDEGITSEQMVPDILELAENKDLDALVLYVNSPGGSANASEQIWEALQQWKKKTGKPFYVSMSDLAASGGYYISCGADKIYAQPTTLTGSIGIFGLIPNLNGLFQNKLGINIHTITTSTDAQVPSILEPMSPGLRAAMQGYVERGYELFTKRCAEGRHMSQDSIKMIAEGRVWDGAEALKIGLVDEIGGLDACLAGVAKELNVETWTVEEYPSKEQKWFEMVLQASSDLENAMVRSKLGDLAPVYDTANRLKSTSTLQTRMDRFRIHL